jgi:hypothetical protein
VRLNQATPAQILTAAERELSLALKRLVGCRNRVYRETPCLTDNYMDGSSFHSEPGVSAATFRSVACFANKYGFW